jgi:hypothetical protein
LLVGIKFTLFLSSGLHWRVWKTLSIEPYGSSATRNHTRFAALLRKCSTFFITFTCVKALHSFILNRKGHTTPITQWSASSCVAHHIRIRSHCNSVYGIFFGTLARIMLAVSR